MIRPSCFRVNRRLPVLFLCLSLSLNALFNSRGFTEPTSFPIIVSDTTVSTQLLRLSKPPADGLIRFTIENKTNAVLIFEDLAGNSEKTTVPPLSTQTITVAFNKQATYLLRDITGEIVKKWRFLMPHRAAIATAMPSSDFPSTNDNASGMGEHASTGSDTPPPPITTPPPATTNRPTRSEASPDTPHPPHHMRRSRRSPQIMPVVAALTKPAEITHAVTPSISSHTPIVSPPSAVAQQNEETKPRNHAVTQATETPEKAPFQPKVLYKSSNEMFLDIPTAYPVDIALNPEGEQKAEEIDFRDEAPARQTIPVSSAYTLALHDDDGAFKIKLAIQKKNETQQTQYSTDGVLHWIWTVTPIQEGEHILNLSISGPHGEFLFPARTIHVHVKDRWRHLLSQIPHFMKSNWGWLSGVAVALWTVFLVLSGRKKPD